MRGLRQRRRQAVRPAHKLNPVGDKREERHLQHRFRPQGHPDEQARGHHPRVPVQALRPTNLPPQGWIRVPHREGAQINGMGDEASPTEQGGLCNRRRQRQYQPVQVLVPCAARDERPRWHGERGDGHGGAAEHADVLDAAHQQLRLAPRQGGAVRLRLLRPVRARGHRHQAQQSVRPAPEQSVRPVPEQSMSQAPRQSVRQAPQPSARHAPNNKV
mmetsp:Transcript_48034/g.98131  ORF Transcript_48034/g.98131 Transcript_48034/m.98131 type:complete len:216 (+) Transcript_48034:569-1216(+)